MLKRRSLVFGAPVAIFATQVMARDVGRSVGPALLGALAALQSVREGNGRGTINILFAPWCHVSPTLWGVTRGFLNEVSLNWIPFSGGQPEGKLGTEQLLQAGTPSALSSSFLSPGSVPSFSSPTPLSDAQDARMRSVERVIVSETGQPLTTPTLVYRRFDDRHRAILGGINAHDLRDIISVVG
jgi:hypothetical protein